MRAPRSRRASFGRNAVRLLALPLLVVGILAVYCVVLGFPPWLLRRATRVYSRGAVYYEAEAARLDLFRGIVVKRARAYRKGVIGPPLASAERVVLQLSPFGLFTPDRLVGKVIVSDGIVRPRMARGPDIDPVTEPMRTTRTRLEVENCVVEGVNAGHIACDVLVKGYEMRFTDIRARLGLGELSGNVTGTAVYGVRTHLLSGRVNAVLDPRICLPVLDAWEAYGLAELVRRFEFAGTPRWNAVFEAAMDDRNTITGDAEFWIADFVYRDVAVLRADGKATFDVAPTNSVVSVDPLLMVREEGIARGNFTIHPYREMIEFDGVSWFEPRSLAGMMGLPTNRIPPDIHFGGPVWIRAKGLLDYGNIEATDFKAAVGGSDIVMERFFIDRCSFELEMQGNAGTIRNVDGRAYGGQAWATAQYALSGWSITNAEYTVNAGARDMDFSLLAPALTQSTGEDYRGTFSGEVRASGLTGWGTGDTVEGEGVVRVRDGRVFLLPVFGPLSTFMTKLIPGLEFFLRQTDATLEFALADGQIKSDKISIEGDILSLRGAGDCTFNGELNFDVQLALLKEDATFAKMLRVAVFPVSKLLEFRVRGTFDSPGWYPRNFSPDLFKRLGLDFSGRDEKGEKDREEGGAP